MRLRRGNELHVASRRRSAELIARPKRGDSLPVYSNNDEVKTAPELPIAYDDVVIVNGPRLEQ